MLHEILWWWAYDIRCLWEWDVQILIAYLSHTAAYHGAVCTVSGPQPSKCFKCWISHVCLCLKHWITEVSNWMAMKRMSLATEHSLAWISLRIVPQSVFFTFFHACFTVFTVARQKSDPCNERFPFTRVWHDWLADSWKLCCFQCNPLHWTSSQHWFCQSLYATAV